jgi:sugar/nucleoside kinase (ribokinase family)
MIKDIDLCGIGNALVDIQIEVDDSVISKFNLVKGGMQLADAHQQAKLINFLSDKNQNKSSGGSAANTIIAFSQLGGKSAYQTVIGDDKFGNFYSKEFTDLGIKLVAKKELQNPTGTCLVLITPDSQRTMITALGASAFYTNNDVDEEIIKRSKWLYIEGYEFTQEDSTNAIFKAVEIAKQNDTKIALTFSDGFIIDLFYDKLKAIADSSDLVFCNESEAMKFSKSENFPETIVYFNENIKNFAITKGKDGSLIKWNNEFYEIPPYSATPKDSTGAGDMFAGAFLYGIINTGSVYIAGHLASISAAKVVSQLGARLNKDELIELKDKIFNNFKEF